MITKEQAILDEVTRLQEVAEKGFKYQVEDGLKCIKRAYDDVVSAQKYLAACKKSLRELEAPVEVDYKSLIED